MTSPKVVAITGTSTGIGRATAEHFAAAGWTVAATMRRPTPATAFNAGPGRIETFALDVTDTASIARIVGEIEARFGGIDVLVNNAGYGSVGPFEAISQAEIRRQLETNVIGLMAVTRAVLPGMRARKSGAIVNVASVGGRLTFPFYSIYHASKWAVEGFSESLRFELRPFGIAVKIIEPGPIRTDFYGRSAAQPDAAALGPYAATFKRVSKRMQRIALAAPGPEIVARAIFKAATDGSGRIRYRPNGAALLTLRDIAGDRIFTGILARILRA